MELRDTILKMKENFGENFQSSIEIMKRKASKGLIEGATPEEIDYIVKTLEETKNFSPEHTKTSIISLIAETEECIKKYGDFYETLNEKKEEIPQETITESEIFNNEKKIEYNSISEDDFERLSEMSIAKIFEKI